MSFLSSFFGIGTDPREDLRPLWHSIVAISREPGWYARAGVVDNVAGRFDMIAAVLALALLRMEREEQLARVTHFLTELFVDDMDGQLREIGIGDLMVGKHMGKLVGVLGGRLGALRDLERQDDETLERAIKRNVTLGQGVDPALAAASLRELARQLDHTPADDLLAGRIAR